MVEELSKKITTRGKKGKERKIKHLSLLFNDLALMVINSTFFTVSFSFCTFLWIC